MEEIFGNAKFDIEHALSMYAYSNCFLPAQYIYDKEFLKGYEDVIARCHIYLIGFLPRIQFIDVNKSGECLKIEISIAQTKKVFDIPLPKQFELIKEDGHFYFLGENNQKITLKQEVITDLCRPHMNFDVRYIGQAYGKDGSRNAIDRLLKHETLQKISLKGVPEGHMLSLLLLEVKESNQLITKINPFAKVKDESGERIKAGLDKLFNTNEMERISLYEAALIRYFCPQFNKEFKNSFPSTNLKILQDCYEKDFSAVIAEICFDDLPFSIGSETIPASTYHCANHDLHKDKDRKAFFFSA